MRAVVNLAGFALLALLGTLIWLAMPSDAESLNNADPAEAAASRGVD